MKDALSRIYFDDLPVKLLGDESRPPLDRIVRAGGKVPGRVDVVVLTAPNDQDGHVLAPDEIIDRTAEPTKPIYLRSVPKPLQAPAPDSDAVISQLGRDPIERQAGRDARMRKREEAQAVAEGEAEERQEEDREQEGAMQDEQEDVEQAQEDEDFKG